MGTIAPRAARTPRLFAEDPGCAGARGSRRGPGIPGSLAKTRAPEAPEHPIFDP